MEIVLIMAILGIAFLILYFIRDLELEHIALRLFGIFMFLILIVLAAKTTLDPNCDVVLLNSSVVNNITINNYGTECVETSANTDVIFYKASLYFVYLTIAYIFIYFLYQVLLWKGIIKRKKKR